MSEHAFESVFLLRFVVPFLYNSLVAILGTSNMLQLRELITAGRLCSGRLWLGSMHRLSFRRRDHCAHVPRHSCTYGSSHCCLVP